MSNPRVPDLSQTELMQPWVIVPSAITAALFELLNTKHLYQSVHIKWKDLEPRITRGYPVGDSWVRQGYDLLFAGFWRLKDDPTSMQGFVVELPVTISTLCHICEKRQPHNPREDARPHNVWLGSAQVLCIPLQCQGCKRASVVFLISRRSTNEGAKLQLTGRSVFEQVEVPTYIPKEQRRYYSDAIIAFDSGQILPALFMLRTLIEQHMRGKTGKHELRGEDLCDEYAKTLDENFKAKFPSFRDIYGSLSDALHAATEDEKRFELERKRIESHFLGKQAFEGAGELKK